MNILSKKMIGRATVFFFALFLAFGFSPQQAQAQYGDASYQTFYDDLAPYGTWMNDPQYGYVWAPNAGNGFRPYYTNGYWAMTEYGNTWISNYAWGWAPFHYGRWVFSDYYGWIWIPGDEWGPAWVTWRQGGGYYGWAPLGPGISISMSFGYYPPDPYWTFIPCNNIYSRSFHRYYSPRRTRTVIRNTTVIHNTYVDNGSRRTYVTGPRRSEVEKVTGRSVATYDLSPGRSSGRASVKGRTIQVYRPEVRKVSSGRAAQATPRTVKKMERPLSPATRKQTAPERSTQNRSAVKPSNNNIQRSQPQAAPQKTVAPQRDRIQERPVTSPPARQSKTPPSKLNRNPNPERPAPRLQQTQPQKAEPARPGTPPQQRRTVSPPPARQEPARLKTASPRSVEPAKNADRSSGVSSPRRSR